MRTLLLHRFMVIALIMTALSVTGEATPRLAQAQDSGASYGVTVPLSIDCAAMQAGTADQQARAREVCGSSEGEMSPNSVVYGTCGSSTLWVWNDGAGHAGIYGAAHSTQGPIVYISFGINWTNVDTGASGYFSGSNWPWSSDWSTYRTPYTGAGYVQAWMSGQVQTALGYVCNINYPWDAAQIY